MPRLDPTQRAREFTRRRHPRNQRRTNADARLDALANQILTASALATQPDQGALIETVVVLPEPTVFDFGRNIILVGGPGQASAVYVGTLDTDDQPIWAQIQIVQSATALSWVRNFAVTNPYHITFDYQNNLWITRLDDHRIAKCSPTGVTFYAGIGTTDATCGHTLSGTQMHLPTGIATDPATSPSPSGSTIPCFYVARRDCDDVLRLSVGDRTIEDFGAGSGWIDPGGGSGTTQLDTVFGVDVDSSWNIYVCDGVNDRISKWNNAHSHVANIGASGTGDGQLNNPHDVAVDSAGNVYVADTDNNRIQKFASNGAFVWKVGGLTAGAANGQFDHPEGIAIHPGGQIHVADSGNDRVQVFDSNGVFVAKYGSLGSGDGQFTNPTGIDINGTGLICVVDRDNDRVSVWQ